MARSPRPALCAILSLAAALAAAAFLPYWLTDGDSCLFASLGHEMASEGSAAWAAPHWAYQGSPALYHEHPPGAQWPAALLEAAGLPDHSAPLVANTLWLALLLLALWRLAGARLPGGGAGPGVLAVVILLLHVPVWKYVVRAGLEIPFAACVTASVAAARSRHRLAPAGLGLALAGALLTRGVFGVAVPVILVLDAWFIGRRSIGYRARLLTGLLLGTLLAAAYDFAYIATTGHGFWSAYAAKQVLPSLQSGGTPHPNHGATLLYYGGRLLVYGLPWWVLSAAALRRARGCPDLPFRRRQALTALVWIAVFFAGAVAARRQGSRYLFAAWPASAWLAATALAGWWARCTPASRRRVAAVALLLVPGFTAGKMLFAPRDAWWRAAELLRSSRAATQDAGRTLPAVFGPFAGHDDRLKQFLRHHLGTWAFREPGEGAPSGSLHLVPAGAEPGDEPVFLRTGLFELRRVP